MLRAPEKKAPQCVGARPQPRRAPAQWAGENYSHRGDGTQETSFQTNTVSSEEAPVSTKEGLDSFVKSV